MRRGEEVSEEGGDADLEKPKLVLSCSPFRSIDLSVRSLLSTLVTLNTRAVEKDAIDASSSSIVLNCAHLISSRPTFLLVGDDE